MGNLIHLPTQLDPAVAAIANPRDPPCPDSGESGTLVSGETRKAYHVPTHARTERSMGGELAVGELSNPTSFMFTPGWTAVGVNVDNGQAAAEKSPSLAESTALPPMTALAKPPMTLPPMTALAESSRQGAVAMMPQAEVAKALAVEQAHELAKVSLSLSHCLFHQCVFHQ